MHILKDDVDFIFNETNLIFRESKSTLRRTFFVIINR